MIGRISFMATTRAVVRTLLIASTLMSAAGLGIAQTTAGAPPAAADADQKLPTEVFHHAEVLDCISVAARGCSHIYPQTPGVELCSLTSINLRKSDGRLLAGPTVGWKGNSRHEGVFVGIKVGGDSFRGTEAYYIYHIGMNVYRTAGLSPDDLGRMRGYCTGQPNSIPGGNDHTHCVCAVGNGGGRQEFCHVYQNGRIVNTYPGNHNRC